MAPKNKVDEFRTNNVKLMREKGELESQLAKFKGVDIEEYSNLKKKMQELEDKQLIDEGQFDELFVQRTQRMQDDYKTQIGTLSESVENHKKELKLKNNQLSDILIGNGVRDAMTKLGVFTPAAFEISIYKAKERFTLDDEGKIVARDADGNKLFSKDGTTSYGFSDFAEELFRSHKDEPWYVQPSTGSDSNGGSEASRSGAITLSRDEAKNPAKYRAAQERARKEGKEFKIAS
jgi:hypothetical protein